MNNYIVYKHICPNGKIYIGITSQGVNKRWRDGEGYKKNKHFYNAIQKYGWENIEHIIVAKNISANKAYALEKQLIRKYNSNDRKYGYNNSTGGEISSAGVKHSLETRRKWSIAHKGQISAMKGKHHTEEARKKISEAGIGRIPYNKGKKMSNEHRMKLSEAHKGHKCKEETKKKLSVIFTGKKLSEETKRKISISKKGQPSKLRKKVICLETGKIYNSVGEAENELKIRHICEVCNNFRKTAGGYHWKYV